MGEPSNKIKSISASFIMSDISLREDTNIEANVYPFHNWGMREKIERSLRFVYQTRNRRKAALSRAKIDNWTVKSQQDTKRRDNWWAVERYRKTGSELDKLILHTKAHSFSIYFHA